MNHDTTVVVEPPYSLKRICWSAIFVGALVGIGLSFLLNLFGIAIGLSVFSQNNTGTNVLVWGGLFAFLIGVIVAMLVAGFAAGYLGRLHCPRRNLGILYGFTTWTLALLLNVGITGYLGNYVMSYSNAIGYSIVHLPTKAGSPAVKVKAALAEEDNKQNRVKITASASPKTLILGAFTVFLTFLIGAIACCIGACWAMTCHRCVD